MFNAAADAMKNNEQIDAQQGNFDIMAMFPDIADVQLSSHIYEPEDDADLGESAGVGLMSGSDSDVAKMINEQITAQVNNQLGAIPGDVGSTDMLTQFEQDKAQASEFLEAKDKAKKKAASDKAAAAVKAMLAEAQQHMKSSQELGEGGDIA